MPSVMIRRNDAGKLDLYVPKKDLEETITSIEFEGPEKWGGVIELADGTRFFVEPLDGEPKLPITLRATKA
ncbi:MAG: putative nitrogen fixation protein NifT [Alphaproteobacteria bacterium CG_4_10_14_0_2_um_filter_63_37]|nr:MAG: putative nitrogen fixation protein NifT [Proteobacteria bacterium CG1_02_64_396]PJA25177.1 MAG: putative nitrogen fixation protein NifT [Alphaproteobacteria bacterium CG_4_10_14_0_2_um_filter_63_37]